jgi:hypothetical protein
MNRVGTFDAFLPCELDRRREATPSAAGPFLHVRGERASSWLCASRTHFAVSAFGRPRSRPTYWVGTQRSAGADCNSFQRGRA